MSGRFVMLDGDGTIIHERRCCVSGDAIKLEGKKR